MSKEYLVPIIMGSKSDMLHAEKIGGRLIEPWGIPYELRVASAHKTTQYVLDIMKEYESNPDFVILAYVTVAGRSNGLSGVVAGNTSLNTIACPPPSDKYAGMDILSSLHMPSGISLATIPDPENAADFVGKMYAHHDRGLRKTANNILSETYSNVLEADKEVRGVKRK